MRNFFSFSENSFQKTISAVLIFLLLLSQTIRFDIYETAQAKPEDYRDIVSIVVDKATYNALKTDINLYARDIAGYLGNTRVSFLITTPETTPANIAAYNEKLYYEGDGESGKSSLVGTILIGNVPIPMVFSQGKYFPSIFPYVDFENKAFIYNETSGNFEKSVSSNGNTEKVEIWHGVINPAVGRNWNDSDREYIKNFLYKTHLAYTKAGRFSSSVEPRILYADALNEGKSVDLRSVFQYGTYLQNIENIAYKRFTKHLLRDINTALKNFDTNNNQDLSKILASVGASNISPESLSSDTLSEETIKNSPDIQTTDIILGLIKKYSEIFNKKVLGEELEAVHNAGRYNSGATVRADLVPVTASIADDIAVETIKKSNDILEKGMTDFLASGSIARKIPILDSEQAWFGNNDPYPYKNYFFGQEGATITDSSQCVVNLGYSGDILPFGRSVLVEPNAAFDVNMTQNHIDILERDEKRCFNGGPKIYAFWGGNSLLRLNASGDITENSVIDGNPLMKSDFPLVSKGFVKSARSLGGMLESGRVANPSLMSCINYQQQYTLLEPHKTKDLNDDLKWSRGLWKNYPAGTDGTQFLCDSSVETIAPTKMVSDDATDLNITAGFIGKSGRDYPVPVQADENFMKEANRYNGESNCLVGSIYIDGKETLKNNKPCKQNISLDGEMLSLDETNYRTLKYHTITGTLLHASPTKEEISAAMTNGATPSLPVDVNHSLEFLTKKGNIASVRFPNFFRPENNAGETYKDWLSGNASTQWQNIVNRENSTLQTEYESNIAEKILSTKPVPSTFDWNNFIDASALTTLEKAKNWLQLDVNSKYKNTLTSMLSYSGNEPMISGNKQYEIAYLGLSDIIPKVSSDNQNISTIQADYAEKLATIKAYNMSEEGNYVNEFGKSDTECGPPDGVSIFKWPSAVKCWMRSQLPPKILAGTCGGDTIGENSKPNLPKKTISSLLSTSEQKTIIDRTTILPQFDRKHISYFSSIHLSSIIKDDANSYNLPENTQAKIVVVSAESQGKVLDQNDYNSYFQISPSSQNITDTDPSFIITAEGKDATITAKIVYTIPLSDGTTTQKESEQFVVSISSAFLDGYIVNQNNTGIAKISVDSNDVYSLGIIRKKSLTDEGAPENTATVTIYDDISHQKIVDQVPVEGGRVVLSDSIVKNVSYYRAVFVSKDGIEGEMTFVVEPGKFSDIRIHSASSAIEKNSVTPVNISLIDAKGNTVAADFHTLKLSIEGGMFIDASAQEKNAIDMSIFDSTLSISVKATGDKNVKITAESEGIKATKDITLITGAQVKLQSDGALQVGGSSTPVRIVVTDAGGNTISGFNSIVSLELPSGAGKFEKNTLTITNGVSETVQYTPGAVAGIHTLTLQIPGLGINTQLPLTVVAGKAMYIDHMEANGSVIFTVRDRYGNIASYDGKGFLQKNSENPREVTISGGRFSMPKDSGWFLLEIPDIEKNSIEYSENSQKYSILAISKYAVYLTQQSTPYDFKDDYNAKYSVFVGGSFLRESEDILYHTNKDNSQSLAASTLLETPYTDDTVFSLFPGGGYSIGKTDTTLFDTTLDVDQGFPVLSIYDTVQKNLAAKVLYRMNGAQFLQCSQAEKCIKDRITKNTISINTLSESYKTTISNGSISLVSEENITLASIDTNGAIALANGVHMQLSPNNTLNGLEFSIVYGGIEIANITYSYPTTKSIEIAGDDIFASPSDSPVLQVPQYQIVPTSKSDFGSSIIGYSIKIPTTTPTFDPIKNGPNSIEDIGAASDNPGVGFKDNNRMLLSYAAGDTVGESTKWFQSYMFVNLGDPVAHVEHNTPNTEIDGLDRTLGTQIADSRRVRIKDFYEKDMNADGLTDIIVEYVDGYIELFLNQNGSFRSAGNIAYKSNNSKLPLAFGDFSGDGYSDIVSVNNSGSLVLSANKERKFIDTPITLSGGNIPSYIQQIKVYDMDADKKDDIVYLTSYGEIGILYGTETPGNFVQKVLDNSLGIVLDGTPDVHGGALSNSTIPNRPRIQPSLTASDDVPDDSMILSQVYYQVPLDTSVSSSNSGATPLATTSIETLAKEFSDTSDPTDPTGTTPITSSDTTPLKTYVRSEYASLAGVQVSKKFTSLKSSALLPGDTIQAEITLQNISGQDIRNTEYLDTIPKIFENTLSSKYTVNIGGNTVEKTMEELNASDYDVKFHIDTIPAGSTAKITYTLKLLPLAYGEMLVGDLEKGTAGADIYGDVGFQTTTNCLTDMKQWLSVAAREYTSSNTSVSSTVMPLPENIQTKLIDSDNNGIPDSVEKPTQDEQKSIQSSLHPATENTDLIKLQKTGDNSYSIGFDQATQAKIEAKASEIFNGLACGFGGGSCMAFPINWAPLAPGNDPVVFGQPIGDGFKALEGVPVFSALTTRYTSHGPVPSVWPPSRSGAGGYFGDKAPFSSFVRTFVSPTLTLGIGGAVCLGQYPSRVGNMPPKQLWPMVQGGNCIVMAKPMKVCEGDGSTKDGDIRAISGLASDGSKGEIRDAWNGKSCSIVTKTSSQISSENATLENAILDYMRAPQTTKIAGISVKLSQKNISSLNAGPLLQIGGQAVGASEVNVAITGNNNIADIKAVVDTKNKRISAFPDFIMDWLTRQTEEITNSLLTPPNLTIIPPTDFGQNAHVDSSYSDFLTKLQKAYSQENFENLKQQVGSAYQNSSAASTVQNTLTSGGTSQAGTAYKNAVASGVNSLSGAINSAAGGLDAIKAAYTFLGKLPFITIRQTRVNISVPWILPSELDQYERKLKEYSREIDRAMDSWCVGDQNTKECLEAKVKINANGLKSSINQNLKRIDEYRRFPEKLQKYVTWKQKLMYSILCNIESVEKMTFGWIKDNGVRFQKWAELYVLLKAIASSWQPMLDIFAQTNAQCGVCRNERYNSQQWKFKLISAIIPKIPVINFPKWPDLVLDLSDIRLGINISVPDFNFRISPIRLPSLPNLSLPRAPNVSITLPTLPVLPPLPELPDLPNLPSLPVVKLPNLPPPPKIPKLSGSIKVSLDIMKLISKLYCYYQKTSLIPEYQVGAIIAQRTERQATLPMDFLSIQFPQFSLPTIKEIRVATHLNYELRSDFITEYAKNAVKPINKFSTDLSKSLPSKIGNDINISSPLPSTINIDLSTPESAKQSINNLQSSLQTSDIPKGIEQLITSLQTQKDIFLENTEFKEFIKSELLAAGLRTEASTLERKMATANAEAKKITDELIDYNTQRFSLLKQYIEEENTNIAEMQHAIDSLQEKNNALLSNSPVEIGNFASSSVEKSNESKALKAIAALETKNSLSAPTSLASDTSLENARNSLINRTKRLAQVSTTNASSYTNSNIAGGYSPIFDGMYVLTEISKTQTKLFDYTKPIDKHDRVDVIDIDGDGDRDYIYILGGILYVKSTHLNSKPIPKILDYATTLVEVPNENPEVPNNFTQVLSTPSTLNISFDNTVANEKEWRMEFYDHYLEWDTVSINKNSVIPKTTVDLFVNTPYPDFDNNGITSQSVKRYLYSGGEKEGFTLEGPKIHKHTGDIFISVSPNRTIYTGNNPVEIRYINTHTNNSTTGNSLILQPNTAYQFDSTTEIRAANGPIFIVSDDGGNERYTENDLLNGLPILPGMKITSSKSFSLGNTSDNSREQFIPNSLYITKSLPSESENYSFSIPYPNGYYYARLHHMTPGKTDRAGITLLAPQASSDATSPVVSINSSSLRVPLYNTLKIPLSSIITELSNYGITIDTDISIDTDKNGIFDDDFTGGTPQVKIDSDSIEFGPYKEPRTINMNLKVQDEFGNTTVTPISLEVYTPIAHILYADTSGFLSGSIDTQAKEPIDIFRIRGSEFPKKITQTAVMTDSDGKFQTGIINPEEVIRATSSGNTWTISSSGIFSSLPTGYRVEVIPASANNPLLVRVFNRENTAVYEQFLSIPSAARIRATTSSDTTPGVFVENIGPGYSAIEMPLSDPIAPGGVYITDTNHNPVLLISKDGNIYTLDTSIALIYGEKNKNIRISARKNSSEVASIYYNIPFFYTTK